MRHWLALLILLLLLAPPAWAANDFVRVQPDSTGKKIDNESFTRGADTIYRQRVRIGGTSDADLITPINSSPSGSEMALPTRNIPSGTQTIKGAGAVVGESVSVRCVNAANDGFESCSQGGADTAGSTNALNALNATATVALAGQAGAEVFIATGSLSGTVVPEVSADNGTTWVAAVFGDPVSGASTLNTIDPSGVTRSIVHPGPITHARVRVSAFTSGTANATLRATRARPFVVSYGSDGSNVRALLTSATGQLKIVCDSGCSGTGGTSQTDNTALATITGTGWLYDTTPPAITDGNVGMPRMNTNRIALFKPVGETGNSLVDESGNNVRGTITTVVSTQGFNKVTTSTALGSLNATATIDAAGVGSVAWEIDTGNLVGTVVFEATLDDTNWFAVKAIKLSGSDEIDSLTAFGTRGLFSSNGYSQVRLRVSAYTSGTSNARLEASIGPAIVRTIPMSPGSIWSAPAKYTAQQTDTSLKAAPGAGLALYITDLSVHCNAAVNVLLEEGGSTHIDEHYCSGQGDGYEAHFKTPHRVATNTSLTVTTSGAVTVSVRAQGYIAP